MLDVGTAEHEAAHVVVGLAMGLRLRRATIVPAPLEGTTRQIAVGYAWFGGSSREGFARTIMYCAGVAWEARPGGEPSAASVDEKCARQFFTSRHDLAAGVRIARELLDSRRRAHARVASELCDRDLTAKDIEALVLDF